MYWLRKRQRLLAPPVVDLFDYNAMTLTHSDAVKKIGNLDSKGNIGQRCSWSSIRWHTVRKGNLSTSDALEHILMSRARDRDLDLDLFVV